MEEVQSNGERPPGSLGDLFDAEIRVPPVRASVGVLVRGVRVGGWEQAIYVGRIREPVYHYDIISAYRWASEQGLPDLSTAYWTRRHDDSVAVWVIRDAPRLPYSNWIGTKAITSEERDRFDLRWKSDQVVGGIGFRHHVRFNAVWKSLERKYPYCWKRIARLFWGRWLCDTPPEQVSWESGRRPIDRPKVRELRAITYNPVWAIFITSRIKLRMAEHWHGLKHVFVDSILTTNSDIPCGADIGDFRRVDEYSKGVWIKAAGQWGTGRNWIKHAGLSANGMDLFKHLPV